MIATLCVNIILRKVNFAVLVSLKGHLIVIITCTLAMYYKLKNDKVSAKIAKFTTLENLVSFFNTYDKTFKVIIFAGWRQKIANNTAIGIHRMLRA